MLNWKASTGWVSVGLGLRDFEERAETPKPETLPHITAGSANLDEGVDPSELVHLPRRQQAKTQPEKGA